MRRVLSVVCVALMVAGDIRRRFHVDTDRPSVGGVGRWRSRPQESTGRRNRTAAVTDVHERAAPAPVRGCKLSSARRTDGCGAGSPASSVSESFHGSLLFGVAAMRSINGHQWTLGSSGTTGRPQAHGSSLAARRQARNTTRVESGLGVKAQQERVYHHIAAGISPAAVTVCLSAPSTDPSAVAHEPRGWVLGADGSVRPTSSQQPAKTLTSCKHGRRNGGHDPRTFNVTRGPGRRLAKEAIARDQRCG
jgi:hypothetical protein